MDPNEAMTLSASVTKGRSARPRPSGATRAIAEAAAPTAGREPRGREAVGFADRCDRERDLRPAAIARPARRSFDANLGALEQAVRLIRKTLESLR